MALSDSAGVGSSLPSQVGQSGNYLTTDGTIASWATVAASGITSFGAVGAAPSANGATVAGSVATLQPADATHPGLVTTGTQTFAGAKTLTTGLTISDGTTISLQSLGGTNSGLWLETNSPTIGNFSVLKVSGEVYLNATSGHIWFQVANTTVASLTTTVFDCTGLGSGGAIKLKSPNGTTFTATISNAGAWVIA